MARWMELELLKLPPSRLRRRTHLLPSEAVNGAQLWSNACRSGDATCEDPDTACHSCVRHCWISPQHLHFTMHLGEIPCGVTALLAGDSSQAMVPTDGETGRNLPAIASAQRNQATPPPSLRGGLPHMFISSLHLSIGSPWIYRPTDSTPQTPKA